MFENLLFLLIPAIYAQEQCFQSRDPGDGSCDSPSAGQRFFFDMHTKRCQPFYFKGCNGNKNSFTSRDECQTTCSSAHEPDATNEEAICASGAYAAGATVGNVEPCSNCPKGYVCENNMCCPTKEYTCNLQYDAGRFGSKGSHTPRYFYSKAYKNCMLFTFYGRAGNPNNFATFNECKNFCS